MACGRPTFPVCGCEMAMIEEDPSVPLDDQRINVILNWFEELKRLVPTEQ